MSRRPGSMAGEHDVWLGLFICQVCHISEIFVGYSLGSITFIRAVMANNSNTSEPTYKTYVLTNAQHSSIIGFFIGILMIAIYLWMASGFTILLFGLYQSYPDNWAHGAEDMIKATVIILASFELIRVFKSYLLIGRVKVTFILDVALVVLIGELISLWYSEYEASDVLLSIFVIASLIALRVATTKFSPDYGEA